MTDEELLTLGNEALALLGAGEVQSRDEGSDLAATLFAVLPTTVMACLTVHPWRVTLGRWQLVPLATPPLTQWRRAFVLPTEVLAVRAAFASPHPGALPLDRYELQGRALFADADQVWIDGQREPPLAAWPGYLRAFVRAAAAADLAIAVAAATSQADHWHARAWGRGFEPGLLGRAKAMDAQQAPPRTVRDFPLLAARGGGR